ncbi:WGR domain-containing protein [Escherichia coli]|uniref:WGR domain-containing protein n=1 Tax=Escherichia coli TaxID=562 RepID=A0A377DRR2_ECOLX|nr:WGR domain-containing protein [Escherichia coli]
MMKTRANDAVNRYKLLKKDARTIAAQQVARLESAMCLRRRWSLENFQLFLVEHPLVRHLTRRLIWAFIAPKTSYWLAFA